MGKLQIALEQLRRQNYKLNSSPPPILSPISPTTTTVPSKFPKCNIPDDLELENVYNPEYSVIQLISTRKHPRKQVIPPRPPNSFFLFKNCYMLELRKLGYRYCMPDVCRQSKQIWSNIPSEVKERYDLLALQAQILHQEMYPEYKFSPKKRQDLKQPVFSSETTGVDSSMLSTFSVTNFLGVTSENDASSNNFESPQLYFPSNIPSFSHGLINQSPIPQPNLDYNYILLNNYYLNFLMQGVPTPSPEANIIYPQIIHPLEFLPYDPNAFNQLFVRNMKI